MARETEVQKCENLEASSAGSSPKLVEAPSGLDTVLASGFGSLFSEVSLTASVGKVSALEGFLNAATKNSGFNDFVHEILMCVIQVVKSEAGSIFELNPNNNCLFFRAISGSSSDRLEDVVVPMGSGVVGHVAEAKVPVIVNEAGEDSLHLASIAKVVGFEVRNLAAIPVFVRGKLYGVLELLNRVGESQYNPEDVELLTYLGNMMGKVIEIRLMLAWARKEQGASRKKAA